MPVRQYLDNTVVPIVLQALTELAKERYMYHRYIDHQIPYNLLQTI